MLDDMIVTGTGDTGFGEINKEADNKISFYDIFEMSDCICFHYLHSMIKLITRFVVSVAGMLK